MEDFYINITSQEESYDYSNITSNYSNMASKYSNITSKYSTITTDYLNTVFIRHVMTYIIICISLPLNLVAIYALYSQVRNDHVAPIYIINLLISDLIQLCCLIVKVAPTKNFMTSEIFNCIYVSALVASVCFMVCVALERYLFIACPLWYRCRRTIKISVVVCVLVWVLPFVVVLIFHFWVHYLVRVTLFSVFLLLPLPLFIFFLGGVLKALSASISVPSDEKRQIVGLLVLVLLIYTLLFLPNIILSLADRTRYFRKLDHLPFMCLRLSPLADLTLYVFMRKGTIDKLLASVCCCRMDSNDITVSSV